MQLDITRFFHEAAPMDYSASAAEIGQSAGADTWRAACDDSAEYLLLGSDDARDAFRAFVRSSGGWTAEEIESWSDDHLNALCIQWVAGDIRECDLEGESPDWTAYYARAEQGNCPSTLSCDADGRIHFDIGV